MPKALLLENIHPDAAQSLREHGFEVECLKGALSEDELIEALEGVDLLGVRSKTNVTRKVIDARPTLTAVGCFCIGTNQVDLGYAGKRGIAVFEHPLSGGTGHRGHHLPDASHPGAYPPYEAWHVGQIRIRLT